jgi:hypothetical protein
MAGGTLMNKLQVMQTENISKNTFGYPAFNFSNCNVSINYQLINSYGNFNILNKNLLHVPVLFFWKITKEDRMAGGRISWIFRLPIQSSTLAVVRWPMASENWFGPVTFAKVWVSLRFSYKTLCGLLSVN